jgi:hypothetical protein
MAETPTRLANEVRVHFPIKDVLKALSHAREIQLLNDVQFLEGLKITVDARSIDARHVRIHEVVDIFQRKVSGAIVENELEENLARRGDAHFVRLEYGEKIPVLLHKGASLTHFSHPVSWQPGYGKRPLRGSFLFHP